MKVAIIENNEMFLKSKLFVYIFYCTLSVSQITHLLYFQSIFQYTYYYKTVRRLKNVEIQYDC